jgi:branched-subunit amino acid aminotransferase/4-amino-4-deoxychorismate lyase
MIVWMGGLQGGEIVPENFAHVDVRDHGLLVGDSLFETVMTRGRHAQLLGRHVARLARSADAVGIACPTADVIVGAVRSVLQSVPDQSVERTGAHHLEFGSGTHGTFAWRQSAINRDVGRNGKANDCSESRCLECGSLSSTSTVGIEDRVVDRKRARNEGCPRTRS